MEINRESVFSSALRSLCRSIATILGIAIGIGIVALGVGVIVGTDMTPPKADPLLMPDAKGSRELLPGSSPVILRLDFNGEIGTGHLTGSKIENVLLDSREGIFKGDRVKAILLHMNTPGGSASDSDTIYRALKAYKQKYNIPIYAYVDGLCASGGMYIASSADKIYTSHSSIIGSVGVLLGPNFNFADTMTQYGVKALTLTQGLDKDELNPFRAWKPDEGATLKNIMDTLYDQFVSIVVEARPKLKKEQLVNTYGARVFIAQEAAQIGYVDAWNSSYYEAVRDLSLAAQIKEDEAYQVIQLTSPRAFFNDIAQTMTPVKILNSLLGKKDLSELSGKFLYYYQP